MKKITGYLMIISISALLFSCGVLKKDVQPVTHVYQLGDSSTVRDGSLVYALPMTVFTISVDLERVIRKPGPYSKFASEMLGLKDVITSEGESWTVAAIKVSTTEELDPSEYYVVESNSMFYANALKLKKAGLILDISSAYYLNNGRETTLHGLDINGRDFSDLGADEYFISQNDTVYRTVKLDTSFIKIPYLVEKKKPLSQEQLAERAAKSLLELRDGKHSILTGEANVFPQSTAGIDEINRMEKEYLELFTGKTTTERKTIIYMVTPGKESVRKPVILFRFSQSTGVLSATANSGVPVVADLEPAKKARDITIIPRTAADGEKVQTFDKLYYRLPDVVTLRIKMDNQVLAECRKLVYQLGDVLQLPSNYIIGN